MDISALFSISDLITLPKWLLHSHLYLTHVCLNMLSALDFIASIICFWGQLTACQLLRKTKRREKNVQIKKKKRYARIKVKILYNQNFAFKSFYICICLFIFYVLTCWLASKFNKQYFECQIKMSNLKNISTFFNLLE